jgi:hypothetical protein
MNQKGRKKQTTNQHQGNNQQPNVPPQPHGQANPGMMPPQYGQANPGMMSQPLSFRFMVFYATFNNISAILWQSVLLVEESRVPGENH